MPDFHEQLRDAAARPTRDVPLALIERRLRARRRSRIATPLILTAAVILGLVAGAAALTSDDGARVTTMGSGESTSSGVSIELPEGWVSIPTVTVATDSTLDGLPPAQRPPTQLIAVGTTSISSVDACPLDHASSADVFVTISEFTPGLAFNPEFDVRVAPRPLDFATAPAFSDGLCSQRADGAATYDFNYVFTEKDRKFSATIFISSDAATARRDEAYAILNSLRVEEPRPAPTAVPTTPPSLVPTTTIVPPSTVPPSDDEAAIRAAFLGWIDTKPPEDGAAYVEDGDAIRETIAAAARTNPQNQRYTGRVDAVSVVNATEADVTYTILFDGSPSLMGRQGRAVKVDGVWKVSRETVCELEVLAPGVKCPPRGG